MKSFLCQQYLTSTHLDHCVNYSWTQMVNVTGCEAKCHYTDFSFNKVCAFRQF